MANELNQILQQLQNVQREVDQTNAKLQQLQQNLRSTLSTAARGGTPTEAGLGRLAGGIEQGGVPSGYQRLRAGGGAYVPFTQELNKALTGIVAEITQMKNVLQQKEAQLEALNLQRISVESGAVGPGAHPPTPEQAKNTQGTQERRREQDFQRKKELEDQRAANRRALADEAAAARTRLENLRQANRERSAELRRQHQKEAADARAAEKARIAESVRYNSERLRAELETNNQAIPGMSGRVEQRAGQLGFKTGDIKSITDYAGQYKIVQYEVKNAGEAIRRLNLVVTENGKILNSTQNRYRTFADSIRRNWTEALKWTIAVGAIYGPMQKLQELISTAIKNESELADITIILGKSHADTAKIFDAAARAANATGESITGVINGYELAYRATGNINDATRRTEVAQKLLTDSLILSKLSTLDQATALDTLAGALRQSGLDLDQGSEMLNKWVAVTKVANVDLKTLAESFAITATSASNAGLSVDELNGIIATVAEVTTLSATEAGNAVRAFISGFQTEKAQEELSKFGIALVDLEGNARGFFDVMNEISSLRAVGLIDDAQLNKIGEALGGGARRGAQYVAFIENLGRVQEVAAASSNAQNDAYDALAIKQETVQTHVVLLNNAFQQLAQTLGTDGGVLDSFRVILDLLTKITEGITAMTKALGGSIPVITAVGAAMALNNRGGGLGGILANVGGLAGARNMAYGRDALGQSRAGLEQRMAQVTGTSMGTNVAQSFANGVNKYIPYIGVGIAEAYQAAINIRTKNWGNLAGQAVGAGIGFAMGGPVGALIGSTIGQGIIGALFDQSANLADQLGADIASSTAKATEEQGGFLPEDEFSRQVREMIGPVGEAITTGIFVASQLQSLVGKGGLNRAQAEIYVAGRINPERLGSLYGQTRTGAEQAQQRQVEAGPFSEEVAQTVQQNAELINRLIDEQEANLRDSLNRQEVSAKQYKTALGNLGNDGLAIAQIYTALAGTFTDTAAALQLITNVLTEASPEQTAYMTALTSQIADLTNKLEELKRTGDSREIFGVTTELDQRKKELDEYIKGINQINAQKKIQLPGIVGAEDLTGGQFEQVLQRAYQEQEKYLGKVAETQGLTGEQIESLKAAYEPWFAYLEERYREVTGLDQQFFTSALDKLRQEGAIPKGGAAETFGIQTVDTTQSAFLSSYNKMLAFITTAFPQYQVDAKETGVIFKDSTATLHLDNLIMQLAMQELIDVNRKQLDGLYNLPSEGTFYVPSQALELAYNAGLNAGGGGAAGGAIGGMPSKTTKTDIDQNAVIGYEEVTPGARKRFEELYPNFPRVSFGPQYGPFPPGTADPNVTSTPKQGYGMGDLRLFEYQQAQAVKAGATTTQPPVSTALKINMNSNIQLALDGRIVATVIKQYLFEDLIRSESAQGGVTKVYTL